MLSHVFYPRTTSLYSMQGRDARDFLHRLTTVNVRDMKTGDFKPGFFLTPQGKIRAHFRLACLAEDSFLLEIEGGRDGVWEKELLAVVDQFTFAEEFRLEEKTEVKNVWIFALPKMGENSCLEEDSLLYLSGSAEMYGSSWISVWGPKKEVESFVASSHATILSEEDFDRRRILALVPRVDHEIVPEANPLELGLRSSIEDGKGCYPGQEVIEKIISIGSPAKRLVRLESETKIQVGAKILLEDGKSEVGKASSVAFDEGRWIALALLRKNALEVGKKLSVENGSNAAVKEIRG